MRMVVVDTPRIIEVNTMRLRLLTAGPMKAAPTRQPVLNTAQAAVAAATMRLQQQMGQAVAAVTVTCIGRAIWQASMLTTDATARMWLGLLPARQTGQQPLQQTADAPATDAVPAQDAVPADVIPAADAIPATGKFPAHNKSFATHKIAVIVM